MNILNTQEINTLVARSQLVSKYAETIDRDSAHEILSRQIEMIQQSNVVMTKKTKRGGGKNLSLQPRMNNIPHEVPNYNYYEDYGQGSHVVPPAGWQESTINKKRTKQNRRNASNYQSTSHISTLGQILNSATSKEIGRTAANAFTRGILGTLGLNPTSRTRTTNRKKN
jgi:hypothetical protein